jgi:hypothetical protein
MTYLRQDGSAEQRPKEELASVQRFRPDFEFLLEGVVEQLAIPESDALHCLYLNPLTKVQSDLPTVEFFEKADKARAEWCRRAKQVLGHHATRTTNSWTAGHLMLNEETNFWHRDACLTGLMFIQGRFVLASHWDASGLKGKKKTSKRAISHQELFDRLLELTSPDYWQARFAEAGL